MRKQEITIVATGSPAIVGFSSWRFLFFVIHSVCFIRFPLFALARNLSRSYYGALPAVRCSGAPHTPIALLLRLCFSLQNNINRVVVFFSFDSVVVFDISGSGGLHVASLDVVGEGSLLANLPYVPPCVLSTSKAPIKPHPVLAK